MQYRKADLADATELAAFGARLFVDSYEHLMERAELDAYVRDHFTPPRQHAELMDLATTTFLALAPAIAGYAQVTAGSRPDCPLAATAPAELKRIYVEHGLHGHGIARELLGRAEAEARRRGCDVLWLAVWEINDRAIAFYSKNGFQVIGRQGFPIGHQVQTDYVMAKTLADELH